MQRHVNDWVGTLKAAIPFLQIMQCNFPREPKIGGRRPLDFKALGDVLDEARDIVKAAEATQAMTGGQAATFESELKSLINRYSKENGSDTPDFILAAFLLNCLNIFDIANNERRNWHAMRTVDNMRGCPKPDVLKTKEERKAEALRDIHKTPYGANLGKNAPEIVPGLKFANQHMPGHSFEVSTVNTEENTLNVYITKGDGLPWPDTWNLEHTRWGFERGEYWELKPDETPATKWEADALRKRKFPAGGVVDGMKKAMARGIIEDIEKKTADTLQGFKKTAEYVPADLWEQFEENNRALQVLWNQGKHNTQEYKELSNKCNELQRQINSTKKEALQKQAADDMARIIETAMKITEAFTVAAKAIKVFKEEEKGASAAWDRMAAASLKGQNPHVANGQAANGLLTDRKGFLFLSGEGQVLWAMHDGKKYCFCQWEPSGWVGWQVDENSIKEASEQQLPLYLDQFIRKHMPTD